MTELETLLADLENKFHVTSAHNQTTCLLATLRLCREQRDNELRLNCTHMDGLEAGDFFTGKDEFDAALLAKLTGKSEGEK